MTADLAVSVWALQRLGVPRDTAEDIALSAVQEHGVFAGAVVAAEVRAWGMRRLDDSTLLLAQARETIAELSAQIDALTAELQRIHREQERGL